MEADLRSVFNFSDYYHADRTAVTTGSDAEAGMISSIENISPEQMFGVEQRSATAKCSVSRSN